MRRLLMEIAVIGMLVGLAGCGDDDDVVNPPGGPALTEKLEAAKLSSPPDQTFWDGADYIEFTATSPGANGSSGQTYAGEYNMTGSKDGISSVVRMKAAYTASDLYIWARWTDVTSTNDLNRRRWYFNGGAVDEIPAFDPAVTPRTATEAVPPGWSSNLNDDKIGIMWDILIGNVGASANDGRTFAQSGCAMACHSPADMYPDIGRTDLWHWKTSRSNPLGYANDQFCDPTAAARVTDTNEVIEVRNRPQGGNNTSGPAFVWNPMVENRLVRWDGQAFDLDPVLFLATGARMPLEGDAAAGNVIYGTKCLGCHAANGQGSGENLAIPGLRWTRTEIVDKFNANGISHGGGNQAVTDTTDQKNLVARIRAFAGAPGYYLQDVVDQNDAVYVVDSGDVYTNGTYATIFKRALTTSKPNEDAQFTDLNGEYPFSVAIMDFDGKNHAGGPVQKLVFRP